jgi:hypothetical protein
MQNASTVRFNRLFLLSILSSCFLFFTQSVLAEQVYVGVGGSHYRQCPRGYRLVFTPKHWRHGYLVPARYNCVPYRYRDGWRHGYYRDGYRDGYRRW